MSRVLSGNEVRREFVRFFVDRGHKHVMSAPLIPRGDPTLLFTSSGMVPFKQYYVSEDPPIRRAVSVQRCLRLSDLEEVGRTPYHGTFFEMLGNFSFGDYFRREAILWGWEFLTDVLELPEDRLWITVYTDDDAAADIWANEIGVPAGRIVRLGDEHNFWGPAGDSGPCGPDSEIHFDMGGEVGCGRPECDPGCDCDRFFEIWNLVFPQFLQHADGTREPLARPGIDTGMGFERLCSVIQGVGSLYETDVLAPLVGAVRREFESHGGAADDAGESIIWVIVDHARAVTFAIAENILPSNEAQGYVVRRLIRRAVRRGLRLGVEDPFLYRIAGEVVEVSGDAHPHLSQKREHIALLIKSEEERFHETLASGTAALSEAIADLKSRGEALVPGDLAFRLYDTYGFPVDLTREMAAEEGLAVDIDGFESRMEGQRTRGREAASFGGAGGARAWAEAPGTPAGRTAFVGYELPIGDRVLAEAGSEAFSEPIEATVRRARAGADPALGEVVLSSSPFYAESGGQVADTGRVEWGEEGTAAVVNVYHEDEDAVHVLRSESGAYPAPGETLRAFVDVARRRRIEKNHTATHLLQASLRAVLGEHVHQSGSWVGPDRLRFDFTHFTELSPDEIGAVEDRVNASIRADLVVVPRTMALDDALKKGAMALFGEKYDPEVRAVEIEGDRGAAISLELCGGTHVRSTGEIGAFAIVSESSVAAGVRRIEAVTGQVAVQRARESANRVLEASRLVRATPDELIGRVRDLTEEAASLKKEIARERGRAAAKSIGGVVAGARDVAGVRVVAARTEAPDIQSLRAQADQLREGLKSGVGVLAAEIGGSGVVIAVVTDDLVEASRVKAGDVVRRVAAAMGGRGGGRPHMAQGGGEASRIGDALDATYDIVGEIIGG